MGDIKFEMNYAGVGELLKWDSVAEMTKEVGEGVKQKANGELGEDGFISETRVGKKRAHTFVKADSKHAYYHNLKYNTLLKALQ